MIKVLFLEKGSLLVLFKGSLFGISCYQLKLSRKRTFHHFTILLCSPMENVYILSESLSSMLTLHTITAKCIFYVQGHCTTDTIDTKHAYMMN